MRRAGWNLARDVEQDRGRGSGHYDPLATPDCFDMQRRLIQRPPQPTSVRGLNREHLPARECASTSALDAPPATVAEEWFVLDSPRPRRGSRRKSDSSLGVRDSSRAASDSGATPYPTPAGAALRA